jgi:hypothetical protein
MRDDDSVDFMCPGSIPSRGRRMTVRQSSWTRRPVPERSVAVAQRWWPLVHANVCVERGINWSDGEERYEVAMGSADLISGTGEKSMAAAATQTNDSRHDAMMALDMPHI